jgi:hypothetical protein
MLEEGIPFIGIVPKLMTEDAKGTRGVTEPACDLMGRATVDEEGTQGFVLPVQGFIRGQEEARLR